MVTGKSNKKDPVKEAIDLMGKDAPVEEFKQQELLASPEEVKLPKAVQNGLMLATYVGLGLERDKDNSKLIHLDWSFPITDEHERYLPKRVKQAYEWLRESGNPLVQVSDLPMMTLEAYEYPEAKLPFLSIVGAEFTRATLQVIEETGKGKTKEVIRFKFRLRFKRTAAIVKFAAWSDDDVFWISLQRTQKELKLED
jgi:hypothetical protein